MTSSGMQLLTRQPAGEQTVFGGFGGFGDFASGFGDIFDTFFGGGTSHRRNGPVRGADLRMVASNNV